ncbi:hypothetical protein FE782_00555 [Paenibacillus antri]|uniref:Uncharacterized protein n=1 Tax=Paenibacillus antri TaxID=2582848 RepID=A0A5R9GLA8_9BACL|nr:hypothetical protein [Paenibacillus antri]TLS53883.1 hypothetical protein FE782_00555 [Paenibacillus antri]
MIHTCNYKRTKIGLFQSILGIVVVLAIIFAFGKAETAHAISEVEKIVLTPQQVTYTEQFLPLRQGGVFQAAIVIGRDASQAELEGAQLLQRVIARQSGGSIPVLYDDQPHGGYSVLIAVGTEGSNAVNGAHRIDVPDHTEGYAIERHQVQSRDLYLITGREGIGAYYGATSAAQLIQTSGDSTSIRVVSVRDFPDLNGARAIEDATSSNGKKAGYIDAANSYVEFNVAVENAGSYVLLIPYRQRNVGLAYGHAHDVCKRRGEYSCCNRLFGVGSMGNRDRRSSVRGRKQHRSIRQRKPLRGNRRHGRHSEAAVAACGRTVTCPSTEFSNS